MKKLLFSICSVMLLSSCFGPRMVYNVGLSNVDAPADAKKQSGETKIISLDVAGKTKYTYEDDFIDISWMVGSSQFSFSLKNKSDFSIKIPWDEVTYINTLGEVGRIMHAGVKYIDRNNAQPASIIPKKASLSDIIQPTDNVYYSSGRYGGWRTRNLFNYSINKKNLALAKVLYIGKTVRILFPVIIKDAKHEYVFEFKLDDIVAEKR